MNRFTHLVASVVLVIPAPFVIAAPAQAAANPAVESCKAIVAAGIEPGLKLGECVSLMTLNENLDDKGVAGNAVGVRTCNFLRDFSPETYAEFESREACIEFWASE